MNMIPRKFYIDDIFDDMAMTKSSALKCDIYEENNEYHIDMEAPGYSKENLKVEIKDDTITITAEKNNENVDRKYIHRELSYEKAQRSFRLDDMDEEKITAEFQNGILKIVVPRKETVSNNRVIDIK